MAIETEHMGFKISFKEIDEVWTCNDLDLKNASLTRLRGMIQKHTLDLRRKEAVPVIVINSGSSVTRGLAMDARPISHKRPGTKGDYSYAVSAEFSGGRTSKQWFHLSFLAAETPDVERAIKQAEAATEARKVAFDTERAAWNNIPRIDPEVLSALVSVAVASDE